MFQSFHKAYGRIDDGFGRKAVVGAGFQPKDVAGQQKRADLAASVGKQLVGPHGAADHLIDIFGRLVFAVNLFVLAIGKFARHKAGVPGETAERFGSGEGDRSGVGRANRAIGRLGEHEPSP
jgi:hypothetical protein